MSATSRLLKIVFLGEPKSGKTSLISAFIRGSGPTQQKPTLFENYMKEIEIDSLIYKLHICDTTGLGDFHRLKKMSFLNTDVFVLCVDSAEISSMQKTIKWIDDIKKTNTPIVLCMTKKDDDKKYTREDIQKFVDDHRLQGLAEVSIYDKKSVKRLFEMLVRIVIEDVPDESCMCCGFRCC